MLKRYLKIDGVKVDLKRLHKTQIRFGLTSVILWINEHPRFWFKTYKEASEVSDKIAAAKEYQEEMNLNE